MERDEIQRSDFPIVPEGYDRASVDAHLTAVAAALDALRARVDALGVEIEAVRSNAADRPLPVDVPAASGTGEADGTGEATDEPGEDPVSARLLVSKLHLDGLGRDEIVERVSSGYRLEDPAGLVDAVIEGLS